MEETKLTLREMMLKEKAATIDHTNLSPKASPTDIIKLCREAAEYGFKAVCILPAYVELAVGELANSTVAVCTVIGFPLGGNTTAVKVFEAQDAVSKGATEIDMVINIAALKNGQEDYVAAEIAAVVQAAAPAVVKVIIETCYLEYEEKITACKIAKQAGAAYVKTSTGLGPDGAFAYDVSLMRSYVSANMGVKAAGGIRSMKTMEAMLSAGASRIGTSNGVEIIKQYIKDYVVEDRDDIFEDNNRGYQWYL